MKHLRIKISVSLAIAFVLATSFGALASSTKVFREKSFSDFAKGELKTTSLSSEGRLTPAPGVKEIWKGEDDLIWRIVCAPGRRDAVAAGTIFFSTGNEGRIYRLPKKKKAEVFCDLSEVAAYALAVDAKGILYAGASPDGKIYRIAKKDEPTTFFETGQEYVWDLAFDKEGNLFAATGTEGKLFKISPKGKGEVYYQAPDKNLMDILLPQKIQDGSIYLASQNKGRIYRVYEKDRAFVLYDSGVDEVRAIAWGEDGFIYAALNSAKKLPTPPRPKKKNEEKEKGESGSSDSSKKEAEVKKIMLRLPLFMGKKSSIIKLDMAGYVWPVLDAPESPIHSLAYDPETKTVLAGIGEKGKFYSVEELNKYTVLFSAEEKYILALANVKGHLYFGTGKPARLCSINWKDRSKGEYLSAVHDADTAVQWGRIRIEGDFPRGTAVRVSTRSGNTKEPDKTWSEWTKAESIKNKQALITCLVARFFQYKLLLSSRSEKSLPVVKQVESYYVPPNRAPLIQKLDVSRPGKPKAPPKKKPSGKEKGKPETSKPADSIDAKANSNPKKVKISWRVTDPEGDKLRYALYFKGEGEEVWKKIEDKLEKTSYDFSTAALPDGRYRIKLTASDIPSNPKPEAKESEYISDIFTIDNTPPHFVEEMTYDRVEKDAIVIHAALEDETSIISSAQYSVNAQDWFRVNPEDGIFDSQTESFSFLLDKLKGEELVVTIMVTDAEGNTVVDKLRITLKKR